MTDLAHALKTEVSRLARKELRAQLEPLRKSAAQSKAQVAALREEVSVLKKQVRALEKQARHPAAKSSEVQRKSRQRFTAKGFATMRSRLGLSYGELGRLIGASDQSVRKWEDGEAIPRMKFQQAIFALRGVGKRALAERLGTASN
jgi:DNA-binding transcriptional regulator YiaG